MDVPKEQGCKKLKMQLSETQFPDILYPRATLCRDIPGRPSPNRKPPGEFSSTPSYQDNQFFLACNSIRHSLPHLPNSNYCHSCVLKLFLERPSIGALTLPLQTFHCNFLNGRRSILSHSMYLKLRGWVCCSLCSPLLPADILVPQLFI